MNRPITNVSLATVVTIAGWLFHQNFDIEGLDSIRIAPQNQVAMMASSTAREWGRPVEPFPSTEPTTATTIAYREPTMVANGEPGRVNEAYLKPLHFATFNLQGFGRTKVDKPLVLDQVARLCRNFEVVALQGIIGPDRDLLPRLVDAINHTGAKYDYLETFESPRMRLAFVFDTQRVETDRRQLYSVADPNEELSVDPLVAWFRTIEVPRQKAWTVSIVNVWIDPTRAELETRLLPTILRAVQNDGRGEDDVILTGSLALDTPGVHRLVSPINYKTAAVGVATDIYNRSAFEHMLVPATAKSEFTGRAGAIDFLRLMNLSIGEAEEISDRIPVWAEFYATEME